MVDPAVVAFTVLVPGPQYEPAGSGGIESADRYFAELLCEPARLSFAIELDGVHVGNTGLKAVDRARGTAECFIEIGEQHARRKGVATRAMASLLDLAFAKLGLSRVTLGVFEFNAPAIGLYTRLGFRMAGHYGWHYADGRFHEVLAMGIQDDVWRTKRAMPRVHALQLPSFTRG